MDLIGNQITKVPIHNHYKKICNQIPIKKVKDFGFFQSLNQILPSYAGQVGMWQNGHGSLAAMAEYPNLSEQNIVSELMDNPVVILLSGLYYFNY